MRTKKTTQASKALRRGLGVLLADWRTSRNCANPRAHKVMTEQDGKITFACGDWQWASHLTRQVKGVTKCETCLCTQTKEQAS